MLWFPPKNICWPLPSAVLAFLLTYGAHPYWGVLSFFYFKRSSVFEVGYPRKPCWNLPQHLLKLMEVEAPTSAKKKKKKKSTRTTRKSWNVLFWCEMSHRGKHVCVFSLGDPCLNPTRGWSHSFKCDDKCRFLQERIKSSHGSSPLSAGYWRRSCGVFSPLLLPWNKSESTPLRTGCK